MGRKREKRTITNGKTFIQHFWVSDSEQKSSETPKWLSLEEAARGMGVNNLHVRVLARDGVVQTCEIEGITKYCASDVQNVRRSSVKFQEEFASDVALLEQLRLDALLMS